jgi:integrase
MLGGGLRVSEAVGLDVDDLVEDADGGTVLDVRQGKGRKDRTVPVQLAVARLVRAYLAATGRRLGETGPLFAAHDRAVASRTPGRLTARRAAAAVLRCADAAGIAAKRVSPHVLRHTLVRLRESYTRDIPRGSLPDVAALVRDRIADADPEEAVAIVEAMVREYAQTSRDESRK